MLYMLQVQSKNLSVVLWLWNAAPHQAHLFELSVPSYSASWQAKDVELLEGRGKLEAGDDWGRTLSFYISTPLPVYFLLPDCQ